MTPSIVRVTWRDSTGYEHWINPEKEPLQVEVIESVGFLIEEKDGYIALALNRALNKDVVPYSGVTVIPVEAIVKKTVLRGKHGNGPRA